MPRLALRFAKAVLATAVIAAGVAPGTARADIVENFESGVWSGGAEIDDNGVMFDCHLSARYNDGGFAIYLRETLRGLHVTLEGDRWALALGTEGQERVRIDNRYDAFVPMSVLASDVIDYEFGYDARAREAIAAGLRITLEGPAGRIEFPLSGTRRALQRLQECRSVYFPPDGARAPYPLTADLGGGGLGMDGVARESKVNNPGRAPRGPGEMATGPGGLTDRTMTKLSDRRIAGAPRELRPPRRADESKAPLRKD
jgi:hypothetical protein